MSKSVEVLLLDTVEGLGIVGDVVHVRSGYARNFLLPRELATEPSDELVKQLAARRADAEKKMAQQRQARESMISKLDGVEITLQRSCNDAGLLYGSVTQQDIAEALTSQGMEVRPRDVRLPQTIKRIDSYEVTIRPETDLVATIKVWVVADRELDLGEDRKEIEFDEEGNPMDKGGAEGGDEPAKKKKAPKKDESAE